ncbi:hypothetical protein AUP68_06253 [Ilyonectria robusta]
MPNYTENNLQLAIQEVAEGVLIRKAANHHNIPYPTLCSRIQVQSADPSPPRLNQRSENNLFTTPSYLRDVQSLVQLQGRPSYNSLTIRRLFRTIGKGLDTLGMKVLQLEEENKALKQQLAQSKKRKRAAVNKDPNKLFISIQNVRATRQRVEPLESEYSE